MAYRVICDRCGSKKWNTELRREWQGLMVCREVCWEPRNAQDFVRGVPDKQNPPWVRPEPADVFIPTSLHLFEDGTIMLLEQSVSTLTPDSAMALEQD